MSIRYWLGIAGLLACLFGTPAIAHPEHVRDNFEIKIFLHQKASEIEVLVRTPLHMFWNVGLPIRGRGYVDIEEFDQVDPHARGDATYAERAANAVNRAFSIYMNGDKVSLRTQAVRVAAPDDSSFENYKTAIQEVSSGSRPRQPVKYDDGYIDALFLGEISRADVDLYFQPRLSVYGEKLKFYVHYTRDGTKEHVLSLRGDSNRTLVSHDFE